MAAFRRTEPVRAALHKLLKADDPRYQALPLMPLAALGHPQSLPEIVEAGKKAEFRDQARDALIRFHAPPALDALTRYVDAVKDPTFRTDTLVAIGTVDLPEATDILLDYTRSKAPVLRAAAARGLRTKRGNEVEERLLQLLQDEHKDVAVAALLSLREVGSDKATVPLLRILQGSRDVFVRSTAILTLGRLAPAEAHAAVRKLVQDPDDRIRASAVEALGDQLDEHLDDVPLLVEALKDPANRVRGNAIVALWPVDKEPCRKPFQELANSPKQVNRATAAWVIGQVQAPELFHQYLPVILTEVDKDVLAMAHRSIRQSDDPRLISEVAKLLTHPNKELRLSASEAFAKMAATKDRPVLLEAATKEQDPFVKAGMLTTLGKLSDGTNFPDLFPFLDERDPRVVANALEALSRVGDLAVVPILRDYLEHRNPRTRVNAVIGLVRAGELDALPKLAEMLEVAELETARSAAHGSSVLGEDLRGAVLHAGEFPALEGALDTDAEGLGDDDLAAVSSAIRAADQSEDWEVAFAEALGAKERDALSSVPSGSLAKTLARYLELRQKGGDPEPEAEEAFRMDHFAPGLFLALEKARTSVEKDNRKIQQRYLDVARSQLEIYQEFLDRAAERAAEGQDAKVFQMFGFLFKKLELSPDVHRRFATHYLEVKEYDLALDHLLRAFAGAPAEVELLVQAAGAAIRCHKLRTARALLGAARVRLPPDSELIPRVEGLQQIVDKAS